MLETFTTPGLTLRITDIADRFGCSQKQISAALRDLGLMETISGETLPTERAEKLRAWAGEARFLGGGRWHRDLIPVLADRLGKHPITDRARIAQNRSVRRRAEEKASLARLLRENALKAETERLREAEMSKLTGIQRVTRMIEMREPVLAAQYPMPGEWEAELKLQRSRAMSVAFECSFDDSYPDFESELVDRVVFTLDEQMAAALKFERDGRATPAVAPELAHRA